MCNGNMRSLRFFQKQNNLLRIHVLEKSDGRTGKITIIYIFKAYTTGAISFLIIQKL